MSDHRMSSQNLADTFQIKAVERTDGAKDGAREVLFQVYGPQDFFLLMPAEAALWVAAQLVRAAKDAS